MTEELKPCPFCGGSAHLVDDLITFYAQCDSCTATGAVSSYSTGAANTWNTRALTAAQPAQAGGVDGSIAASLGDIVAVWDQHAPSDYMTAIHMQAKRALAGQQPVSPDMHGWCAYVGGMVAHWVTSEPDAHARLGDERFEAAIAGIIKRRLWAMPKPTQQAQAGCNHVLYETADAGRPKEICDQNGEVVLAMCKLCGKAESELEAAQPAAQATPEPVGCVWIQPDHLQKARVAPHLCRVAPTRIAQDFVPLSTHPAPGVPDVEDLRDRLVAISAAQAKGGGNG